METTPLDPFEILLGNTSERAFEAAIPPKTCPDV
jgi:hypothetical protein